MPMDVKGILETQADEFLDIDLDCLEDELLLDEYDDAYVFECRKLIEGIRQRRGREDCPAQTPFKVGFQSSTMASPHGSASTKDSAVLVASENLSPFNTARPERVISPTEVVARDLSVLRRASNEEKEFDDYLAQSMIIDETFVDQHIDLFNEVELRAIVRKTQLSEAFLEKYFGVLDHKAISEHQRFSEEFFIRHYDDLDAVAVLRHGPNEWRHKGKQSSKLNVFLRLKGVRI